MKTITLFDEAALRKRITVVYGQMGQRAKPKLYLNGRKAGHIRIPGIIGLPFTREQLWNHALHQVGTGATQCSYCLEIGRNANLITLANCVFDHVVPIKRGGTWQLSNIRACCAQCNTEKGHLSYPFFVGIMAAIYRWDDQLDRAAILSCLRSHGVTRRIQFQAKPKGKTLPLRAADPMLAIPEDF